MIWNIPRSTPESAPNLICSSLGQAPRFSSELIHHSMNNPANSATKQTEEQVKTTSWWTYTENHYIKTNKYTDNWHDRDDL